jgi:hypothetical protein
MSESIIILLEKQKLIISSNEIMNKRDVKIVNSKGSEVFGGTTELGTFFQFNFPALPSDNYKIIIDSGNNQITKHIAIK